MMVGKIAQLDPRELVFLGHDRENLNQALEERYLAIEVDKLYGFGFMALATVKPSKSYDPIPALSQLNFASSSLPPSPPLTPARQTALSAGKDVIHIQRELNVKLGSKGAAINIKTLEFLNEIKVGRIVVIQPTGMNPKIFDKKLQQLRETFESAVPQLRTEGEFKFHLQRLQKTFPPPKRILVISSDLDHLIAAFKNHYFVAFCDMNSENIELRKLN